MTKWVGVLGGGAAAAVVGTGLYISGVLSPDPELTPPQQAAVVPEADPAAKAEPQPDITPAPAAEPVTSEPDVTDAPAPDRAEADAPQPDEAPNEEEAGVIAEKDVATEPEPEPAPQPSEAAAIAAPSFDIVRVEPDGSALVAGQGVAGSDIQVLLDGKNMSEARAGRDGKFVSLLSIAPSDQPRLLSLIMRLEGAEYPSESEIIIAPFGAEPKLAEADPAAEEPTAGNEPEVSDLPQDTTKPAPTEEVATEIAAADAPETVEETIAADDAVEQPVAAPAEDPAASPADEVVASLDPAAEPESPTGSEPDIAAVAGPAESSAEDDTAENTAENTEDATTEVASPEPKPETETITGQDRVAEAAETPGDDARGDAAEPVMAEAAPEQPTPAAEPQAPADSVADAGEAPRKDAEQPTESATSETDEPASAPPQDETAPPTLLASDEDGVRVLQGPEVLDAVAIDTISYDDQGDVALAGRGTQTEEGGFVRVYLDNTPVTSSRIREDGSWRVNLPEVDKGVYTLRVDEVDDEGTVKSRAETPFQREDRETLERVAGDSDAPLKVITVQPGNTLWQIARERYGEGLLYVRVFEANKAHIRNPDLIYPGQVFDLPEGAE